VDRNSIGWQNCRDEAEINIKAGLGINKIGRWQKYKGEITRMHIDKGNSGEIG
jgi:hypothetical protein